MNTPSSRNGRHSWRFFRSGGFDQVALESADDLRHLAELDPKLWTALNCPTTGLEFDAKTLALLDADGDGQIRVPEVLAAVQWACARVKDPQGLFDGGALPLAAINDADEQGATLRAAATQVLAVLGKPEATTLCAEDFADMTLLFAAEHVNGDGVVPTALAAGDEALQQLIDDIIATQGAVADRSGEDGVTAETLAAFCEQAEAVLAWRRQAGEDPAATLPLGEDGTAAAAAAMAAVAAKVDDFFTRCRLAAFDARATEALNPAVTTYGALADHTIAAAHADVAALPLATVEAGASLPLGAGLNPAWAGAIDTLRTDAIEPLLGEREALSAEDWAALSARLAPYAAWQAERPETAVHELDSARIEGEIVQALRERLAALIETDANSDTSATTLDALQRLTHFQRDLVTLLRNFVTMSDFYGQQRKAVFQAGTLYLDQRSCELVLRVPDMGTHATMAPFSGCFLVYCKCVRAGADPITIAAALTGGEVDELMVPGRNGVFYDREGHDWKATVVKVVEQPVSIRQAFWTPYRRVGRFIENQIRNFAASKDKDIEAKSQAGVAAAGDKATAGAPAAAPPAFDIARFAGIFAAMGLAIGAIGAALAAALTGLFQLALWQLPLVLLAIVLVISGPSMLLAWLTLRRRSLGPLLDANGWAVNARARINLPFGRALTGVAALPAGSRRSLADPYADKKSPWPFWLGLLVIAGGLWWAWRQGWLAALTGGG
jgi:hypothetical protein